MTRPAPPVLTLTIQPGRCAVARLPAGAAVPDWALAGSFVSLTRTVGELSIVAGEARVPEDVRAERGWRCLAVEGPIPFETTGVVASVAGPLAEAGVSLFVVSTFDTDYVLVKEDRLERAARALRDAGHLVLDAPPAAAASAAAPGQMTGSGAPAVAPARDAADLEEVAALFREYGAIPGIAGCLVSFDREVASLPGPYGPPGGALLLARVGGEAAGCVGLRRLDAGTCEMKRLYVRPGHRGSGAGRLLALALLAEARRLGYARMRLDTLPGLMASAVALYRSLGFREIPPYGAEPVPGALHMEKDLT